MNFTISTINCQGLGDKVKRQKFFSWLNFQNFDISISTETNCFTLDQGREWERNGGIYWAFASNKGSGVESAFNKKKLALIQR